MTKKISRTWEAGELSSSDLALKIPQLQMRKGGPLKKTVPRIFSNNPACGVQNEHKDIAENRYVKAFLQELDEILNVLLIKLEKKKKKTTSTQVRLWQEQVYQWLSEPIWTEIGGLTAFPTNSQKLQRTAGYRDILAFDIQLKEALSLPWKNIEYLS